MIIEALITAILALSKSASEELIDTQQTSKKKEGISKAQREETRRLTRQETIDRGNY